VPDEPVAVTGPPSGGLAASLSGRGSHPDPVGVGGRVTVVYLVRHGRTALNADGVLRGRLDPPLDDVGYAEATALGARLRNVRLAVVVTSPLRRACQTAAMIAQATGAPLEICEGLADRDYGPWAGTPGSEVVGRFGSLDAAPGVEPATSLVGRVVSALEDIAGCWPSRSVAVVAHDAVNRHAIAALVPDAPAAVGIPQRTGCWNRLERRPAGWAAPIVDAPG
jgi:broad specificity phosphatase PhoE